MNDLINTFYSLEHFILFSFLVATLYTLYRAFHDDPNRHCKTDWTKNIKKFDELVDGKSIDELRNEGCFGYKEITPEQMLHVQVSPLTCEKDVIERALVYWDWKETAPPGYEVIDPNRTKKRAEHALDILYKRCHLKRATIQTGAVCATSLVLSISTVVALLTYLKA